MSIGGAFRRWPGRAAASSEDELLSNRTFGPRLDRRNLSGEACVQLTTTVQEADLGL
jgi:hypothetical protein